MAASNFTKTLGDAWCRMMHDSPMWPIMASINAADASGDFL